MSGFSAGREQKAEDFIKKAQKELKRWGLFAGESKYENAADFYAKAAAQFKICKNFEKAAQCYLNAAANNLRVKNTLEATTNYREAAKAYQNADETEEAVKAYTQCTQFYLDNDRFNAAAKIFCEIAQIHKGEGNFQGAIKGYDDAVECFNADNDTTSANKRLLEIADIAARMEDYKRAIEIFEKVSQDSIDNNLLRWSVKGYYFKAMLCQLCLASKTDDVSSAQEAFERYQDLCDLFVNTREATFVQNILGAFGKGDLNGFKDAVAEYDQISPLNDWNSRLLYKIQERFTGPTGPAAMPDFAEDEPATAAAGTGPAEGAEPDFS